MSKLTQLESQAITAAKNNQWQQAISFNKEILDLQPDNLGALNRLGFAYIQLDDIPQATTTFKHVLSLEKNNPIATKQLANIQNNHLQTPQFNSQSFVEEPSKAKIVSLHRLANKQVLEKLIVGQQLVLKLKNRFISIETQDKTYLGSLPEDISLRLSQLIQTGNQYSCQLHSASGKHCRVFIKEIYQSPTNRHQHSFVSTFQPGKDDNIGEDLLLLADESPLNILNDDADTNDANN